MIETLPDADVQDALGYIAQRLNEIDADRDQLATQDQEADGDRDGAHRSDRALTDTAVERAARADERDMAGLERDQAAAVRDDSADARVEAGSGISERTHAAYREHARSDRDAAARDRKHAEMDREASATDELTGARRRGDGLAQLGREIDRARRARRRRRRQPAGIWGSGHRVAATGGVGSAGGDEARVMVRQ